MAPLARTVEDYAHIALRATNVRKRCPIAAEQAKRAVAYVLVLVSGTGFTGAEGRLKGLRILPASHVRTTFGCLPLSTELLPLGGPVNLERSGFIHHLIVCGRDKQVGGRFVAANIDQLG